MQLLNLTELSLILMLMSYSRGQDWTINTNSSIIARKGSNPIISCTFTYPSEHQVEEVYWKTTGQSECSKDDKDKLAFVFHPESSCVLTEYQNKTELIGDKATGDCSLKILNVQDSSQIYLRVVTNKDKFSFKKNQVSISVDGMAPTIQPALAGDSTFPFEGSTGSPGMSTSGVLGNVNMYLTIFIPVAFLLICAVAGTVVYVRHRRAHPPTSHLLTPGDKHQLPDNLNRPKSHTFTRKESGYYVNFSRAPSNPAPTSEVHCKALDKKPTEDKPIDDPIYINFQTETNQTNQDTEHTDGIYANMDYSSPT